MNKDERYTHFQGFAKLLWDELIKSTDPEDTDDTRYLEIIAQRAYDLACHVLYETSYGMDKWDITGRVSGTPDLTEWPSQPPPTSS